MFFFCLAFFIQKNGNNLEAQENFNVMLIPSTSQENSNVAAILVSTEITDNDDDNADDFLPQENIKLMPIPLKSTKSSDTATILISSERIGDDDNEDDDFQDDERMELLPKSSTSQGNSNASAIRILIESNVPAILKSSENDDDDEEEAHSFTTQKLFSFAWQIAKGMVSITIAISK